MCLLSDSWTNTTTIKPNIFTIMNCDYNYQTTYPPNHEQWLNNQTPIPSHYINYDYNYQTPYPHNHELWLQSSNPIPLQSWSMTMLNYQIPYPHNHELWLQLSNPIPTQSWTVTTTIKPNTLTIMNYDNIELSNPKSS